MSPCATLSAKEEEEKSEGLPSTERYTWSKKHGIPEMPDWHILGETHKEDEDKFSSFVKPYGYNFAISQDGCFSVETWEIFETPTA